LYSNRIFIDKDSPVPIYHQVATSIRERIMKNEWKEDEKIPSEAILTKEYDISRVTLRQALNVLDMEGIIKKIQGKGVFVKYNPKPFVHDFSLPTAMSSKLEQSGHNLNPVLLTSTRCGPISHVNELLKVSELENLVYIKRLFLFNNKPIGLNRSWLAESMVPDITEKPLLSNSLSKTLAQNYNLTPASLENSLQSIIPNAADLKLLNVQYTVPATLLKSVSYLNDRTPLEYSETIWLGESVKFTFNTN
jgi:DNA-binding GntR family transcriptional regulator